MSKRTYWLAGLIAIQVILGQSCLSASAADALRDINRLYESAQRLRPKIWTGRIASYKQLVETYGLYVTGLVRTAVRSRVAFVDSNNAKIDWVAALRAKIKSGSPTTSADGDLQQLDEARTALVDFAGADAVEKVESELPGTMDLPRGPRQTNPPVGDFILHHKLPTEQPGMT